MSTTPQVGLQSKLYYGVTTSGATAYTQILHVSAIDGPEASLAVVEFPELGRQYKIKLPGQSDAGEVTFTVGYNGQEPTHQFLTALLGTQTLPMWKIEYPDGSKATFPGFLSTFGIKGMEADSPVTADATITLEDGATITPS